MAYIKTVWENLPSTNTPVNATNLNKMEQGIYDANDKNVITANASSNITISTGGLNNYPLNNTIASTGNKLSLSNGKIVIGAGVNHILVSAKLQIYLETSNGDAKNLALYKNDSFLMNNLNAVPRSSRINFSTTINDLLVNVQENDTISCRVYGGVGDQITASSTYVTVEVID